MGERYEDMETEEETHESTYQDIVCDLDRTLRDEYDFRGNTYRLAQRMLRKQATKENEVQKIYIAMWESSRHYGGPEEGGWYYDIHTIATVRFAFGWKRALKIARDLQKEYGQPRFNRYSAANRGEADKNIKIYSSIDHIPEEQTKRPRYE